MKAIRCKKKDLNRSFVRPKEVLETCIYSAYVKKTPIIDKHQNLVYFFFQKPVSKRETLNFVHLHLPQRTKLLYVTCN